MQDQIHPVVPAYDDRARQQLQKFLLAVNSYRSCATKEPSLTFEQHLRNVFAMNSDALPRHNYPS